MYKGTSPTCTQPCWIPPGVTASSSSQSASMGLGSFLVGPSFTLVIVILKILKILKILIILIILVIICLVIFVSGALYYLIILTHGDLQATMLTHGVDDLASNANDLPQALNLTHRPCLVEVP